MWTMILPLLKSKTTWVIVAFVALLGYHNIKVWDLDRTIEKQEITIAKIKLNYHTCTSNFEETIIANQENSKVIEECSSNLDNLNIAYEDIVNGKDDLIIRLRNIIASMKVPVEYPTEIVYKECKVKIKGVKDVEDNDVLGGLIGIGN